MTDSKPSRKESILQALAEMLENDPGARITTAGLAKAVGVTEAALYRHFPSKRKMFEALIEFAEDTVFSRCQVILQEEQDVRVRLQQLTRLVLIFGERNPGLCRVLTGEALVGENEALRKRASQFFERLETEIRQILKEGEIRQGLRPHPSVIRGADWVMTFIEGRIQRFTRSGFSRLPSAEIEAQWQMLVRDLWVAG
ncbi:transcriptional regulator, TetR family [Marinobacter daqiaonensis]|uniref:Nucleoid occlusion factor SlmA n=1 Tax=Marinobacter daqiaonensis TaxID=650891 RepID=A0A1I6JUA5_9GAMM|nr:nucleoid occlusion factor SlmA [Marinobacter daqiaonensis]SFR82110.1 transcriptional regulator, TetR family [Marinobacter daqiaonensis]